MFKATVKKTANVSDRPDHFAVPGTNFGECAFDFSGKFANNEMIGSSLSFYCREKGNYYYGATIHTSEVRSFSITRGETGAMFVVVTLNSVYQFSNVQFLS